MEIELVLSFHILKSNPQTPAFSDQGSSYETGLSENEEYGTSFIHSSRF